MVLVSGRIDLSKTMPESSHPSPDLDAMLAHSGWVRALARSLVADPDLADDIEQQTWLTAMRRPPSHDRNLRSWLGSVVRSMAGMHWRESEARQRRERVVADRQQEQGLRSADAARPESLSERMETFRELAAAVAGLQEPYGTSVYLRYFEELSVREVARRTKVPVPTAQSRISRGVQMLRTRMENRLGDIWRQRCLVFTLPLAKAPWWGVAAIVTMTLKTKLMLGAAVLALLSLFVIQPWETQPAALEQDSTLAAAELDAQTKPVAEPLQPVAEVERTELAPEDVALGAAPAMDNEKQLSFRVLDAVTLEPVPDAEVWYFDYATDPDESHRWVSREEYLDAEQVVKRFGVPKELGPEGDLQVPFPEGYAQIIALTDTAFAHDFHHPAFYTEGETIELLLKPMRAQEVEVVDANGLPVAGIEVEFRAEGASTSNFGEITVVTDALGQAVFRHLETKLRDDQPTWFNTFAVPVPGVEPPYVEVLPANIGETKLRFVVPDRGTVIVHCLDEQGTPIRDGYPIHLQRDRGEETFSPMMAANSPMVYVRDGKATFHNIGVGQELVVGTHWGVGEYVFARGLGPADAGQTVEMELRMPKDAAQLDLQLVSFAEEGPSKGFYSTWTDFFFDKEYVAGVGNTIHFDADGKATLVLPENANEKANLAIGIVQDRKQDPVGVLSFGFFYRESGVGKLAESPLKIPFGEHCIVAGTLVDPDGNPQEGARMVLRIRDGRFEEGHRRSYLTYINLLTDEKGRFRFQGPEPQFPFHYTLHAPAPGAMKNWGVEEPLDFQFGQEDLRVELDAPSSLKGRLIVSNPKMLDYLQVRGTYPGERPGERRWLEVEVEPSNGRFVALSPPNEGLTLEVLSVHSGLSLLEIPLGTTPRESIELDLRDQLFLHTLRVSTFDHRLPASLKLQLDSGTQHVPAADNKVIFLAGNEVEILDVWADGYRAVSLISNGETDLHLDRGIPVTFQLPERMTWPEETQWMMEFQLLAENRQGVADRMRMPFGPEGLQEEFTLYLPESGAWQCMITPREGEGNFLWEPYARRNLFPQGFEILDQAVEQAIVLPLRQADIDSMQSWTQKDD